MFDLACANAKREGSKCSVCTRMTVATHNRQSRLGQSQLRTDDMYDSLFRRIDIKQANVELFAVLAEGLNLLSSYRIFDGQAAVGGRYVVINCCHRALGPAHTVAISA